MVVTLLDRLLSLMASLKMAIVVILSLAFYLGLATFYEARFGGPAVQAMVYGSPVFVAILLLLAINVAAAVIVRYPWKRKQTGFIITHIGIEILLAGCVISIRQSVDAKVELRPGQTIDQANLNREHIFITWGDPQQPMRRSIVADYIPQTYPDPLAWLFGLSSKSAAKPPTNLTQMQLDEGMKLTVDQWLPAARFVDSCQADDKGTPAVQLRLHGTLPNGMAQSQSLWVHSDIADGAVAQIFGGVIEATLTKAKRPEEVEQFLKPIDLATLGEGGRVSLLVDGAWKSIDVRKQFQEPVDLGNGATATVQDYWPAASDDNGQIVNVDTKPITPTVRVVVKSAATTDEYIVSARYPFTTRREKSTAKSDPKPMSIVYDHPAIVQTQPLEVRGRLQLLQGTDEKLYFRRFGLRGREQAGPVTIGDDQPAFMAMKMTVDQHLPRAKQFQEWVPQNIPAKQMAEASRAARVTLTTGDGDGKETHSVWLARGDSPKTIETSHGTVMLVYTFDAMKLPFSLSLKEAKIKKDPGSDNPAAYESRVVAVTEDGSTHDRLITMNEPATFAGLTFYQQNLMELGDGALSVLSVRRDPGWIPKYAGCGLIVAGIFTMFYMKAYFQKPRPAPTPAKTGKAFDPVLTTVGGGA